ncbi:cadherin-like domain-containing protein [Rhizobium sp. 18055]|uniref:cadherin-like domain-containing protein n=1 Tax=Rhizobium sp. 18055 TaxID=2681403 RepID=UPI002452BC44|nr:cadherin-like domain-containing protein [Rhizobium sp. 18055]
MTDMSDRLILGLPDDGQASMAPANRFRLAEDRDVNTGKTFHRGADRRLYSLPLLFGALGLVLGSSDHDDAAPARPRDANAAAPQATGASPNVNLAAIEDVAAFLHAMTDELMASTADIARRRHVASVRLSFEDAPPSARAPNLADTVLRSYNANDNEGRVNINGEHFRFPPANSARAGRQSTGQSVGQSTGQATGQTTGQSGHGGSHPPRNERDEDAEARANRLPVSLGRNVLANGMVNLSTLIFLDDLLAQTSDPDGDQLQVGNLVASSGSIRTYGDGIWLYTPERGFGGTVTFSYQVSDGHGSIVTRSVMSLLKAPAYEIDGSDADDRLLGTPGDDLISARGGDDFVYAREGRDIVFAGDGDDTIFGGDGDDLIHGEGGNDRLFGGLGNDVLFGGAGNDDLHGEDGNDTLMGEAGNDRLYGGSGNDRLFGAEGNDSLLGEAGDDLLEGGNGDDDLAGGAGKDVALGGEGNDRFRAGLIDVDIRQAAGAAAVAPADGDDTYVGGDGNDTYDASAATSSVTVDLAAGTATGAAIGTDHLSDIENVEGTTFDDTLGGNEGENRLEGGAGNDRLTGAGGDDMVHGGDGDDTIIARAGSDDDSGHDGNDAYDGGDGSDTLDLSALIKAVIADIEAGYAESEEIGHDIILGFETIIGGGGDDRFSGGSDADILFGGGGDDRLDGRSGDDHLVGGDGNDRLYGGSGNDVFLVIAHMDGGTEGDDRIDGGDGDDAYDASATIAGVLIDLDFGAASGLEIGSDDLESIENAIGGSGNDVLVASISVNVFTGNDGDDIFVFQSVAVAQNGGDGWDEITDFRVGDRLDLSGFADQAGTLMFAGLEHDGAQQIGRISFFYEAFGDDSRTVVRTIIDLDHDDDIQILLRGHHELTQQDFILVSLESGTQNPLNQV